jgi:hypothetical protein
MGKAGSLETAEQCIRRNFVTRQARPGYVSFWNFSIWTAFDAVDGSSTGP